MIGFTLKDMTDRDVVLYVMLYIVGIFGIFALRILYRKRCAPHRPLLTCVLDSLLDPFMYLKLGPFGAPNDINQAVRMVVKQTGLNDFGGKGPSGFVTRYQTARKYGLERTGGVYSPLGHLITQNNAVMRLKVRLNFVAYLKKHPTIEQVKQKAPIFVIGFPRTGTTFLHELLGLHPSVRMHYSWEQMEPVPRTDDESAAAQTADRKLRYAGNKTYFNLLLTLAGDAIQSIHRIGYDDPEECTTPISMEVPLSVPEIALCVAGGREVVDQGGAGEAFVLYEKFLKLLTWQDETRRDHDFTWMLKCPFHLPYLNELHEVFPGSTVVWTHRDPVQCIGSACSLYETLLRMPMEENSIHRHALGRAVVQYSRMCLDKAMDTIARLGSQLSVVHVRYEDSVKDSKNQCLKILRQAGITEQEERYGAEVDKYIARSSAERQAAAAKKTAGELHSYCLADYGLSEQDIRATFADYIEKYRLNEDKKPKKQ